MKKILIAFLGVFILIGVSVVFAQRIRQTRVPKHLVERTVETGGLTRTFYVFVPEGLRVDKKTPLVLVFHGGGGTALSMDRSTKFSELAQREKFIVVYPQGVQNRWNDGRLVVKEGENPVDDVAFVRVMLERVIEDYDIDEKRIFSTGPSNGGFFSNYLAAKLSEKIAAIAPVIGGISDSLAENFDPEKPVSVFIIQGTEDKLVPYDGGTVARNRGEFISTDDAVLLWIRHNKTKKVPIRGELPDTDKEDGCTTQTFLWTNGKNDTEVQLFKLKGGGHTWPGGTQYLPKFIVGNVCRDFDGAEVIWEFFKEHPKP